MELIIGGAYQGKLRYAMDNFGVNEDDVFECSAELDIDNGKRCLHHFEQYILYCMREGKTWEMPGQDAVVIADDIFCGVVPMDEETRAWREESGRALTAIARQATGVTRVFCGLPWKLK